MRPHDSSSLSLADPRTTTRPASSRRSTLGERGRVRAIGHCGGLERPRLRARATAPPLPRCGRGKWLARRLEALRVSPKRAHVTQPASAPPLPSTHCDGGAELCRVMGDSGGSNSCALPPTGNSMRQLGCGQHSSAPHGDDRRHEDAGTAMGHGAWAWAWAWPWPWPWGLHLAYSTVSRQ